MSEVTSVKEPQQPTSPVVIKSEPVSTDNTAGPTESDMHCLLPRHGSSALSPNSDVVNLTEDGNPKPEPVTPPNCSALPSSTGDRIITVSQTGHQFSRTDPSRKFNCKYCFQTFSCDGALEFHELCHAENFPYRCSFCSKKFLKNKTRDEHEDKCKKRAIIAHIRASQHGGHGDTSGTEDTASLVSDNSTIEMIGTPQTVDCESFDDESQSENPRMTPSEDPAQGIKAEYLGEAHQPDQPLPVVETTSTYFEKTDHCSGQTSSLAIIADPCVVTIKTEPIDREPGSSSEICLEGGGLYDTNPNMPLIGSTGQHFQNDEVLDHGRTTSQIGSGEGIQQTSISNNLSNVNTKMNCSSSVKLGQEERTSSEIHHEQGFEHGPTKTFGSAKEKEQSSPNSQIMSSKKMNGQSYQNQKESTSSQINHEQGFGENNGSTKSFVPVEEKEDARSNADSQLIVSKEMNCQFSQNLEESAASETSFEQRLTKNNSPAKTFDLVEENQQSIPNNQTTTSNEVNLQSCQNLGTEQGTSFQINHEQGFVQNSSPTKTFGPAEKQQSNPVSQIFSALCKICYRSFNSVKTLKLHEQSHSEVRPYKCSLCALAFKKNSHLKNHAQSVHGVNGFKCNLCKRFCMNESELKMHEAEHTCPKCGRVFSALYMMRKHVGMCSEAGQSYQHHGIHVSSVNTVLNGQETGVGTDFLGNISSAPSSFQDPETTESDVSLQKQPLPFVDNPINDDKSKPYQQYPLPGMSTLETGSPTLSNVHTLVAVPRQESMSAETQGQRDLTFERDGMPTSSTEPSRSQTRTSLHGNQRQSPPKGSNFRQTHPNQCAICYQIFKTPQGLKRHSDQHFEHRPFKCTLCPLGFKRNTHLSDHMKRVHSYEGFKCSMCRAFCPSHDELMKHEALHACPVCGIYIKTLSQVEAHKKIHIKEESQDNANKSGDSYYVIPDGQDVKQQGPTASQNECPVCHKIFETTRGLEKHSTQHTEIRPYKCHICSFGLKKNYDLAMHLKRVHGKDGFKCKFCRKFCATKVLLAEHEASHDCSLCQSRFFNLKLMEKHMEFHLTGKSINEQGTQKQDNKSGKILQNKEDTQVDCHICQTSLKSSKQLICHLKEKHLFTAFRCGVCRKDFVTEVECKEHESSHFCSTCGKKFLILSQLEKHMKKCVFINLCDKETVEDSMKDAGKKAKSDQDDKDRRFQCNKCSWAFKRNTHLADHMKRVHLFTGFKCKFCRRFSQTESEHKEHEALHICTDCGRGISQLKVLQQHKLLHKESGPGREDNSRPHSCQLCGLAFKRKEHLKGHVRQVHPTFGYQCSQCKYFCQLDFEFKQHMLDFHLQNVDMAKGKHCKACFVFCQSDAELQQHNAKAHAKTRAHKCKFCSWRFVAASQLQKHMKVHRSFKKFGCPHCAETFNFKKKLDGHIAQEHPIVYGCATCGYSSKSQEDIKKHSMIHASFKCNFCHLTFKSDEEKSNHESKHIQDLENTLAVKDLQVNQSGQNELGKQLDPLTSEVTPNRFYCHFCQGEFNSEQELTEHIKTHLIQNVVQDQQGAVASAFSCRICGKKYKHKNTARNHERSHFQPQKFNCKNCYRRFYSEEKRDSHQTDCKPNYFRCKHCTECFKTKTKLESHEITTHTGEYFVCKFCGKNFSTKVSWRMHEKLHTKEKDVICPTCGKAFHYEANLKEHILHNHSSARPFQCMYCGLGLKTIRHLKWHERQHRGENIYKCEYCGKEFKCRTRRQVHVQNEHLGRKHKCDTCGKGFTTSSYLKQHVRIHTGEKPFKCPHCDARFRRAHHVTQHIPRHFKGTA